MEECVFIAGAGPVGLVAAANLIHRGVPVTMFEAGATLSEESRASTFHPPTLDMLDAFGVTAPLMAQGLKGPRFQYRSKKHGLLAEFDFGVIADVTGNPYRVQCEQSKLTRILYEQMRGHANFEVQFDSPVKTVRQTPSGIEVTASSLDVTRRFGVFVGLEAVFCGTCPRPAPNSVIKATIVIFGI